MTNVYSTLIITTNWWSIAKMCFWHWHFEPLLLASCCGYRYNGCIVNSLCVCVYTYTCHTHAYAAHCIYTHVPCDMPQCTHARGHTGTHARRHTHTHARTQACTHARVRTHARTHAHTHARTHTPYIYILTLLYHILNTYITRKLMTI